MVTIIKKLTGGAYPFYEYACLSTDVKPASLVPENSICHEIDTGKHFYFGNGEWKELPPKGGSGGGSGGSGLPEPTRSGNILQVSDDTGEWEQVAFPLANEDNAGTLIGITGKDGVYKYSSVPAPSGGAEKFVVTLTEDDSGAETVWTADKTIAEIVAADAAGKIIVAKVPIEDELSAEIPCSFAMSDPDEFCAFSGSIGVVADASILVNAIGFSQDGSDAWEVGTNTVNQLPTSSASNNGQVLGVADGSPAWVDSNAPLIVTLTAGQTEGQFVGDKTHQEAFDAFVAGRSVILHATSMQVAAGVTLVDHSASNYVISAADTFTSEGSANDYITVTVGG